MLFLRDFLLQTLKNRLHSLPQWTLGHTIAIGVCKFSVQKSAVKQRFILLLLLLLLTKTGDEDRWNVKEKIVKVQVRMRCNFAIRQRHLYRQQIIMLESDKRKGHFAWNKRTCNVNFHPHLRVRINAFKCTSFSVLLAEEPNYLSILVHFISHWACVHTLSMTEKHEIWLNYDYQHKFKQLYLPSDFRLPLKVFSQANSFMVEFLNLKASAFQPE